MLKNSTYMRKLVFVLKTLLISISIITIHLTVTVQADITEDTISKYRSDGYEAQKKGRLNDAYANYLKAVSLGMEEATLYNDLGIVSEKLGKLADAELYYQKALEIDKGYLPAYINLAYLYQQNGHPEKAFKYFKLRYEMSDPQDPWAEKAKQELLNIHPEYKTWILAMEAKRLNQELAARAQKEFIENVRRSNEHYRVGKKLFAVGAYREAIEEYDHALRLTPNNPRIIKDRRKVILELTKNNVRQHSEQAIKMLNTGDSISARNEIQKMLTNIPNAPVPISH